MKKEVLHVRDLSVVLHEKKQKRCLVNKVNFAVHSGECLGILGESGSGKSMTVKAIMGLLDSNFETTGEALFEGRNLIGENSENLRKLRGSKVTMVLQNPMTCFDPLCRISLQMAETFAAHTDWSREEIRTRSLAVLDRILIHDPEEALEKYPHQLSGGMLQRIMIGIAMALEPALLIADEPTTAIDAITQYEVLEAFCKIKESRRTAMLFISHDLGAISRVADRILVMNNGCVVDEGDFHHILHHAQDSYTSLLVEKKRAVMNRYRAVIYNEKENVE